MFLTQPIGTSLAQAHKFRSWTGLNPLRKYPKWSRLLTQTGHGGEDGNKRNTEKKENDKTTKRGKIENTRQNGHKKREKERTEKTHSRHPKMCVDDLKVFVCPKMTASTSLNFRFFSSSQNSH